jgi:hypothetical protein
MVRGIGVMGIRDLIDILKGILDTGRNKACIQKYGGAICV